MNRRSLRSGIAMLLFMLVLRAITCFAGELETNTLNSLYFYNFENIYDANGAYKSAESPLTVGDHMVGIINLQNIDAYGGVPVWAQNITSDLITGVFAHRVEAVSIEPSGTPHVVLGPPTLNTFCKGTDCISTTGILQAGEVLALFRKVGAGVPFFEFNGTLADDFVKASGGTRWLTFGYSSGEDNVFGSSDDNGYLYNHAPLYSSLINFVGGTSGGLNVLYNNTGYNFCKINDPNEYEIGGTDLYNDYIFTSELEGNPDSPLFPGGGSFSPWDLRSNDPAHLLPCSCSGKIGDLVWYDKDRDGIQDAGETGIPGVQVSLTNLDSNISTLTTTNENGQYQFTSLCAGNYVCEVTGGVPTGYTQTLLKSGSDPAVDNNGSPAYVTLNDDTSTDLTIDFGFVSPCSGSIGDFVWQDLDRDGIQDQGEPGLHNVKVTLTNTVTNEMISVWTNNGSYLFNGLCAGTYTVTVETPAGLSPTISGDGTNPLDSNSSPANVTLLEDNSSDLTIDFGFVSPCTGVIGDFVWHDKYPNGIQNAGEPGIEGVTVKYTNISNGETSTTTTVAGGLYTFTGLCPGEYKIEVDPATLPPNFTPTDSLFGTDRTIDSNGSPATAMLTLDVPSDLSIDFGYTSPCAGEIGNFVWNDLDKDGMQSTGEPGIEGVKLLLKRLDNVQLAEATTNATGYYSFTGLCAGDYKVEVVPPAGSASSPSLIGDSATDSNTTPSVVNLPTNESSDMTVDFGFFFGSIGDRVWNDANKDGVQDAGEAGLVGWIVTLTKPDSTTVSAATGADGIYTFSGLAAGLYQVCVTPIIGYTQSYDLDGLGTPNCAAATLDAGQNRTDVDFGYYQEPVTADCVSIEAIEGVAITPVTMTASGGAGAPYTFSATGLPAGLAMSTTGTISGTPTVSGTFSYTVTVTDKDGNIGTANCSVTVQPPVTADCVVIDAIQGVAIMPVTMIASGGAGAPYTFSATGLPAGLAMSIAGTISGTPTVSGTFSYTVTVTDKDGNVGTTNCSVTVEGCRGSIGDFVWNDIDQDGIQDFGEPGIEGVKVTLSTGATMTTDAAGFYAFTGLCAGTYTVTVETPAGFSPTLSNQGFDSAVDSNGSPATVTLPTHSSSDFTIDFGFSRTTYGCTFTIGYWKNHAGFGPQPDVVTPLLPQYLGTTGGDDTLAVTTAKIAYDILSQNVYGNPENGITKLYAQLLAAKLNIKAGADPAAVAGIISQADRFLAENDYSDWFSLSSKEQDKVLSWQKTLDDYNNGLLGPGHCGSQEVLPCIDISKQITVDGGRTWLDADSEATAAIRTSTGTASYRLIVNNCGQGSLSNIDIDDPQLGIYNYIIPSLAAGASTTLTSSKISKLATSNRCTTAGAFENVAFASATYNDHTVNSYDSAWLVCKTTNSCIDVSKDISIDGGKTWFAADTQGTAPVTTAPHAADYKITVKNCGNSTLSNVVIKDPDIGLTSYNVGTLSSGAYKTFTYRQISQLRDLNACSTSGSFLNTAFVSGTYNGITLADNDSAWLVCNGFEGSGCSYTIGYWKTHTMYDGVKKRNSTWDECGGEKTLFFETGQSWYQVLMTTPSENNPYYILAHQFIAAFLNNKAGADTSAISAELALAEELLSKYDGKPYKMTDISGSLREDFIRIAATLDMYNNGEIGPGHCR